MKKGGVIPAFLLYASLSDVYVEGNVNVAAGSTGVGADFMCFGDECVGSGFVHAGQGDVEDDAKAEVILCVFAEADVGVNRKTLWYGDFFVAGNQAHRADEAGGVASSEELFGVGACAVAAQFFRRGEFDVQFAVIAFGSAVAAAGNVSVCGVECGHGFFPLVGEWSAHGSTLFRASPES